MNFSTKNMKKMLNSYLNSLKVLHLVFIISALYLGKLIMGKRDDLLILFILICAVVYILNKNMILVLLVPLLSVMFIEFMRLCCNMKLSVFEGFTDSKVKEIDLVMKYIIKSIEKPEFKDYQSYDDLSEMIDYIIDNFDKMTTKNKKELYSELKKYFEEIMENDDKDKEKEREFATLLNDSISEHIENNEIKKNKLDEEED